ncbi:MAG: TIGR02147 family protein [Oligoflexus sp.]
MSHLTAILLSSQDASEAIKSLIVYKKNIHAKFTIGYICRKLGINYRSYLSDVTNRRKKLAKKYWHGFCELMELSHLETDYLLCLLQYETTSEECEDRRLSDKLSSLKKQLSMPIIAGVDAKENIEDLYFSFEIYATFGVFNCRPSHQDLIDTFGASKLNQINKSLNILLKLGLIERQGAYYQACTAAKMRFPSREQLEQIHHLALKDAASNIRPWIHDGDQAFFYNCTLSVKKEAYVQQLHELKRSFRKSYSDMETGDADSVVKMLVQVYPFQSDRNN